MAVNSADAAAAYRANALKAVKGMDGGDDAKTQPSSAFMDMVKGALHETIDANREAEKVSMDAVAGRADMTDVVTAVAHAENTLRTVVTVRDRIISAYQEILRMPI